MKHIRKSEQEPPCLVQWKEENLELTVNRHYRSLKCKPELRAALVQEQGGLCAYTMQRIDFNSCHIEHLTPQDACKWSFAKYGYKYADDTSYFNMLACYPASGVNPGYGAFNKNAETLTVSPLDIGCEQMFSYFADGQVQGNTPQANKAIDTLKLNHKSLVELRRSEIKGRGVSRRSTRRKSKKAAEALAEIIMRRDTNGNFSQFCVAVRDVALRYARTRIRR